MPEKTNFTLRHFGMFTLYGTWVLGIVAAGVGIGTHRANHFTAGGILGLIVACLLFIFLPWWLVVLNRYMEGKRNPWKR